LGLHYLVQGEWQLEQKVLTTYFRISYIISYNFKLRRIFKFLFLTCIYRVKPYVIQSNSYKIEQHTFYSAGFLALVPGCAVCGFFLRAPADDIFE
jgi:hypothetical protein